MFSSNAYIVGCIYNPHEQVYLVCTEGGHYILQTLDNLFFYLGEVPDTNTEVPLQRIENVLDQPRCPAGFQIRQRRPAAEHRAATDRDRQAAWDHGRKA
ncbi:hypothetical protein [Pseudomonas sp. CJQ_13]|uniref:hypothetical protein n=1 Tax=Pseudomonas sp. CJQ_13 TaxID=3367170 RepID=UPI00370A21C5|nr:hypothetical protein [Pseudomonas putida]